MIADQTNPLRVGVVGLGKMGLLHAAILNALPGGRVAAVTESSEAVRSAFAGLNPGVRCYADFETMLTAGSLDAIVITTPVADHVAMATRCHDVGIPFFVEKPLATSLDDARSLLRRLTEKPLTHMVGYMSRFLDSFRTAKAAIDSGCLGRLHRVTGTIYVSQLFRAGRGWRYDRQKSGGGVLLSQGSHLVELLTWYLGPVATVNAHTLAIHSKDIEDFGHLILHFKSGLTGWLDCSWSVRSRRTVETTIDLLGENGSLVVNDDTVKLQLDRDAGGHPGGTTLWQATDLYSPVPFDVGGPHYSREDMAFLAAVASGTAVEPNTAQACHVQAIVEAAYRSAARDGAPEAVSL